MRRKIVAILLAVMTVSTAVIGCGDNKTTETESKKVQTSTETSDHDEIKKYIKNADINIYSKLRLGILGRAVNLPGAGGRNIIIAVYHVAQKFYGFN